MSERREDIALYVQFEGVATRLATHPLASAPWSLAGTYVAALKHESFSTYAQTLNRHRGLVEEGGLSFRVLDTSAVRGLLRVRGGTETQLATAVSRTHPTVVLASGTNTWPNGTKIYLDRETVTLGTHTASGTYTGCTRGVDNSYATEHDAGAKISDVPLFWYTRRATVKWVDLKTSPATAETLMIGTLSESPTFADGAWSISLTGVLNDYLNRPLLTGFQEIVPDTVAASAMETVIDLPGTSQYNLATSSSGGLVRVDGSRGTGFFRFESGDLTGGQLTLKPQMKQWGVLPGISDAEPGQLRLRQAVVVHGSLATQALAVMLSKEGTGSASIYDRLPGRLANTAGAADNFVRRRAGAGLEADWVDEDSWEATTAGDHWSATWLDEPTRLVDFLCDNILWRTGAYCFVGTSGVYEGKIAAKKYTASTIRALLTTYDMRDESLVATVNTVDDETQGLGRVEVVSNYEPIRRTYERTTEFLFFDGAAYYGERVGSIDYKSKGLNLYGGRPTIGAGETLASLEGYFDRLRARTRVAGRRLSLSLPWKYVSTFVPAYRFALTDDRLPSHESATLGVTARPYEVVGRTVDVGNATVTVECDELPRGHVITPSAEVASWDGGTLTLTLSTTGELSAGVLYATGANVGQTFCVGGTVRLYDVSAAPPLSVSSTATVASVGTSTVVVSGAFSFTPAAGDILTQANSADTGNPNTASADVEDFMFGGDASYLIGTGTGYERAATRWT